MTGRPARLEVWGGGSPPMRYRLVKALARDMVVVVVIGMVVILTWFVLRDDIQPQISYIIKAEDKSQFKCVYLLLKLLECLDSLTRWYWLSSISEPFGMIWDGNLKWSIKRLWYWSYRDVCSLGVFNVDDLDDLDEFSCWWRRSGLDSGLDSGLEVQIVDQVNVICICICSQGMISAAVSICCSKECRIELVEKRMGKGRDADDEEEKKESTKG